MQGYMNITVRVAAARAQAQLKALQTQVSSLEKELGKGSSAAGGFIGDKHISAMAKWGNQVQWTGRQISYNFTLPLAIAAGAAVKWQLANEKAFTQVQKVYGDTQAAAAFYMKTQKGLSQEMANQKATQTFNNELAALQKNFKALSNYYGVNQAEVINVAAAWAAAGASGKDLAVATEATMKAIILGDMDSAAATQALISIQSQYQLNSEELMKTLAQLNAVENQTGISMQGLIEGFERAAGTARTAGVSTRELAAMLAALTPATGSAANAGNALKTILSRLMAPTKQAADVMAEMGINVTDMSWKSANGAERLKIMEQKFDKLTDSGKAFVSSIIASRWQVNKFDVLMRELGSTTGFYQKALDATSSDTKTFQIANQELQKVLSSNPRRLQIIWTTLQNGAADAVQPLIPYIIWLAGLVKDLVVAFQNIPAPVQKMILVFAVLLALFGPLLKYFGSTATLIGQIGLMFGRGLAIPVMIAGRALAGFRVVLGSIATVWGAVVGVVIRGLALIPTAAVLMATGVSKAVSGLFAVFRFLALVPSVVFATWRASIAAMMGAWAVFTATVRAAYLSMQLGLITAQAMGAVAAAGIQATMMRSWMIFLTAWRTTGMVMFGAAGVGMRTALLAALSPAKIFAVIGAAFSRLGPLLLRFVTGPVGLVVTAVIALLVLCRKQIMQVWTNISDWWSSTNNNLVENIIKAWYALPAGVQKALIAVAKIVQTIALKIYELFSYLNPFAHHSPSLVENVTKGMDVIRGQFARLSGIKSDIAGAYSAIKAFGGTAASLGLDDFSQDLAQIKKFAPGLAPGFIALHNILNVLNADMKKMEAAIAAQQSVVDHWQAALDKANAALDAQQTKLDALQKVSQNYSTLLDAAQQKLQDWASTPIKGMQAMSDQIFANEQAQKKLRLEMLKMEQVNGTLDDLQAKMAGLNGTIETLRAEQTDLRGAGAGSDITGYYQDQLNGLEAQKQAINDQMKPFQDLNKAMDELQRKGEMLDLQNSLQFDPLTRQIELASKAMNEMPFSTIMAGISAAKADVDKYTGALAKANAAVDVQKAVVDRLTAARDATSKQLDAEKAKLDKLNDAYSSLKDAINAVESAMRDMSSAASAAEQAKKAKKAAADGPMTLADAQGGNFADVGGTGAALRTDWSDQSAEIDKLTADLQKKSADAFKGIDMFGPIKKKWSEFTGWWGKNISPIFATLGDLMSHVFDNISGINFGSIFKPFKDAWGWISKVAGILWQLFSPGIHQAIDGIKKGVQQFWDQVGPALSGLKDLVPPIQQAWAKIGPVLLVAAKLIGGAILLVLNILLRVVANVIGPIIQMIGGILRGLILIIKGVVQGVLAIINGDWKLAFTAMWNVVKGVFDIIWSILKGAVKIIWGIIKGLVEGIVGFFKWLYDVLVGHSIVPDLVAGIIAVFKLLVSVPKWIWDHVLVPIYNFFKSIWDNYIKPAVTTMINGLIAILKLPVTIPKWIWDNVLMPLYNKFKGWWSNTLAPKVQEIVAGIAAKFHGISALIKWVNDKFITPLKGAFDAFTTAVGKIFEKLKDKISGPIDAIKGWINSNLIDPLNKVVKLFGITIPKFSTGGGVTTEGHGSNSAGRLRDGGKVKGFSSSSTADNIPIWATANEYMQPVSAVRHYGLPFMDAIRRKQIPKDAFSSNGFFLGGLIDKGMSKVQSWMEKGPEFAINSIMNPAKKLANTAFPVPEFANKAAVGGVGYIQKAMLDFVKGAGGTNGEMPTNPGLAGALAWANSQVGKPYIWGGVGPEGYDCSGFMSAITNYIQGRPIYNRRFATGSMPAGIFQPGAGAFSVAWFKGSPGHTAGTLNGVNVESRGGKGVVTGASARGATNSLFNSGVYHLPGFANGGRIGDPPFDLYDPKGKAYNPALSPLTYDSGGMLPPGLSAVVNNSRKPEPVFAHADWAAMRNFTRAATRNDQTSNNTNNSGTTNNTYNFHNVKFEFPNVKTGDDAEAFLDNLEGLVG